MYDKWFIIHSKFYAYFTEDIPAVGTDVDIQLLDAAKAGDLELVRVSQLILLKFISKEMLKIFLH